MKFTKETLYRALRTFLQAALAYLAVNLVAIDPAGDKNALRTTLIGLAVSATAAGLAAAMNLEKKGDCDDYE